MSRANILALLGVAVWLAGCAKPESTIEVRGQVTLDEQPLAEGEIYFITLGLPPEIVPIKDGSFAGRVNPGPRRVEICAYRRAELPPTATVVTEAPRENFIPARYNSASVLTAEISKTNPNRLEFALKSK